MHLSECYRLLGIPRNATLEDIKVAYRRLARKYHPDINQNDTKNCFLKTSLRDRHLTRLRRRRRPKTTVSHLNPIPKLKLR